MTTGVDSQSWSFSVCADDEAGVGALMVGRSGLTLDEALAQASEVVRELAREGARQLQVDVDCD